MCARNKISKLFFFESPLSLEVYENLYHSKSSCYSTGSDCKQNMDNVRVPPFFIQGRDLVQCSVHVYIISQYFLTTGL